MPPQTNTGSPNPDFDFMLKQQPQKSSSRFSGLNAPAKILIAAVLVLFAVIAASMFMNRGAGGAEQIISLVARGHEIIRVSQLQEQELQDSSTRALAATATAALQSQQAELTSLLSEAGVKVGGSQLAAYADTETDARLQTAAQNNRLDDAYTEYLESSLTSYQASRTEAYKTAQSTTVRNALESAYDSITTLLDSPQFKR